ncbi:hypothetical protein COT42_03665 [Candidatus Saganbacteria bacterium CG08_land_8_20_14_0_20_45_16]|uniref:Cytochrome aa3 subunit 2 n=1 Tax=Candidatus Saganbacteria bacterium CG08_land_8_20_14_0_20_45_16 TaxID=2014293 RepID=A0A2H0XYU0_UNCSA|nr:MAG: hypothetical protein COT42_03665 [Candidatus Saganbacteria bacterium CG08_land_8_20_14_0_20_45_16]
MRYLLSFLLVFGLVLTAVADENDHMMMDKNVIMDRETMIKGLGMIKKGQPFVYSLDSYHLFGRAKEFNLTAYQFDFFPKEIKVKKGDRVRLFVASTDVKHGIFIKEYNINVAVEKESVKVIEFVADKPGEFEILCSVFCGLGHRNMKAKLIVQK